MRGSGGGATREMSLREAMAQLELLHEAGAHDCRIRLEVLRPAAVAQDDHSRPRVGADLEGSDGADDCESNNDTRTDRAMWYRHHRPRHHHQQQQQQQRQELPPSLSVTSGPGGDDGHFVAPLPPHSSPGRSPSPSARGAPWQPALQVPRDAFGCAKSPEQVAAEREERTRRCSPGRQQQAAAIASRAAAGGEASFSPFSLSAAAAPSVAAHGDGHSTAQRLYVGDVAPPPRSPWQSAGAPRRELTSPSVPVYRYDPNDMTLTVLGSGPAHVSPPRPQQPQDLSRGSEPGRGATSASLEDMYCGRATTTRRTGAMPIATRAEDSGSHRLERHRPGDRQHQQQQQQQRRAGPAMWSFDAQDRTRLAGALSLAKTPAHNNFASPSSAAAAAAEEEEWRCEGASAPTGDSERQQQPAMLSPRRRLHVPPGPRDRAAATPQSNSQQLRQNPHHGSPARYRRREPEFAAADATPVHQQQQQRQQQRQRDRPLQNNATRQRPASVSGARGQRAATPTETHQQRSLTPRGGGVGKLRSYDHVQSKIALMRVPETSPQRRHRVNPFFFANGPTASMMSASCGGEVPRGRNGVAWVV